MLCRWRLSSWSEAFQDNRSDFFVHDIVESHISKVKNIKEWIEVWTGNRSVPLKVERHESKKNKNVARAAKESDFSAGVQDFWSIAVALRLKFACLWFVCFSNRLISRQLKTQMKLFFGYDSIESVVWQTDRQNKQRSWTPTLHESHEL
jgi:hypothetical protein